MNMDLYILRCSKLKKLFYLEVNFGEHIRFDLTCNCPNNNSSKLRSLFSEKQIHEQYLIHAEHGRCCFFCLKSHML